nr:hypothetical protein CFP56_33635 [Quercus suber]
MSFGIVPEASRDQVRAIARTHVVFSSGSRGCLAMGDARAKENRQHTPVDTRVLIGIYISVFSGNIGCNPARFSEEGKRARREGGAGERGGETNARSAWAGQIRREHQGKPPVEGRVATARICAQRARSLLRPGTKDGDDGWDAEVAGSGAWRTHVKETGGTIERHRKRAEIEGKRSKRVMGPRRTSPRKRVVFDSNQEYIRRETGVVKAMPKNGYQSCADAVALPLISSQLSSQV